MIRITGQPAGACFRTFSIVIPAAMLTRTVGLPRPESPDASDPTRASTPFGLTPRKR